jgi:hypothetical protein
VRRSTDGEVRMLWQMVKMGVTEVLLSLISDPELMGAEHQHPALLALVNLACEPSNLPAMTQAGTLDVMMMLLTAPAVADSDLCVFVLNLLLAYTGAGTDALDALLQSGISISLIYYFITHAPPPPAPSGLAEEELACEVWHGSQTTSLQILCSMVDQSSAVRKPLFDAGLPGLVLTVLSSDSRPVEHQLWAMRILVACAQEEEILANLACSDAVDVLLRFVARESVQGKEVQRLALETLALLSADGTGAHMIVDNGLLVLDAIISNPALLGSGHQLAAFEVLAWVSSKGEAQRMGLMSSGIMSTVISLVGSEQVAGHALMHPALITLNNLSLEEESRIRMVQMGILEALANVVVFECPGTDWQARALGIVSSIALLQEPEVQQAIVTSGIIQSVNTVLLHYSAVLPDTTPAQSAATPDVPDCKALQRTALQVSVNLSAAAGKTAVAMVQHGAVEALMGLATGNEPENRNPNKGEQNHLYAIKALKNLSYEPTVVPHLEKTGVQALLVNLEKDGVMAELDRMLASLSVD